MGVVNANADSFSDPGQRSLETTLGQVTEMVEAGATVIDIGGQSGITNVAETDPETETLMVLPVVKEVVANFPQVTVSVDTYKPEVAAATLGVGAHIINDVSGLASPELGPLVAAHDAALVIMHTAAPPKTRLQNPDLYGDICIEVGAFLESKLLEALEAGVKPDSVLLDPGPDFTKTPAQTIELLRGIETLNPRGLPLLLALSRKDFVGALTERRPTERLAGTLGAIAVVGTGPGKVLRVHDVAAVKDFLTVFEALSEDSEIDPELALGDKLRWASGRPDGTTLAT